jgi:hypothetical protein
MAKSSFINLCDSSKEDGPSLLDAVVHLYMDFQLAEKQLLHLDVSQTAPFTNVVDSLKIMSLTSQTSFESKSLDYSAITIEYVNCFPTKFNGDILFELFFMHHSLGHFEQLQDMDKKYDGDV